MAWVERQSAEYRLEGSFVALNARCARKLGTGTAAYLCHALYIQRYVGAGRFWSKRVLADRDPDGRMIPPEREIDQSFEYETGLTRSQQENARKVLAELGVLKTRRSSYQGRLEYVLDLDRLGRLEKEWAEEERGIAHAAAQEVALQEGESSVQESENSLSSIKSIQTYKECRRTTPANMAPKQTETGDDGKHVAHFNSKEKRRKTVEPGGILCWTDHDRELSDLWLQQFGIERIREAVAQVEAAGNAPYPSVIKKILFTSSTRSKVEQTSAFLMTFSIHDNEKEQRAAARKVAQGLSASDHDKFLEKFIEENAHNCATSFNFATRKFSNPAEKLQFKFWLERHVTVGPPATP